MVGDLWWNTGLILRCSKCGHVSSLFLKCSIISLCRVLALFVPRYGKPSDRFSVHCSLSMAVLVVRSAFPKRFCRYGQTALCWDSPIAGVTPYAARMSITFLWNLTVFHLSLDVSVYDESWWIVKSIHKWNPFQDWMSSLCLRYTLWDKKNIKKRVKTQHSRGGALTETECLLRMFSLISRQPNWWFCILLVFLFDN